jgi:hypothetical protein
VATTETRVREWDDAGRLTAETVTVVVRRPVVPGVTGFATAAAAPPPELAAADATAPPPA